MKTLEDIEGKFGKYVTIGKKYSAVTFKFQDGPINEVGENGCQIEELGKVWLTILEKFNKDFHSKENDRSIIKIKEALMWQEERTKDRIQRKVEGYSKK